MLSIPPYRVKESNHLWSFSGHWNLTGEHPGLPMTSREPTGSFLTRDSFRWKPDHSRAVSWTCWLDLHQIGHILNLLGSLTSSLWTYSYCYKVNDRKLTIIRAFLCYFWLLETISNIQEDNLWSFPGKICQSKAQKPGKAAAV